MRSITIADVKNPSYEMSEERSAHQRFLLGRRREARRDNER